MDGWTDGWVGGRMGGPVDIEMIDQRLCRARKVVNAGGVSVRHSTPSVTCPCPMCDAHHHRTAHRPTGVPSVPGAAEAPPCPASLSSLLFLLCKPPALPCVTLCPGLSRRVWALVFGQFVPGGPLVQGLSAWALLVAGYFEGQLS